ncbi:response regulator [Lichenicoccus roseus]|uniref:Response regulator n=1 Tax=Lichenicoccus roseus TaxID=2683649 RepID=A0A5R9JCD0_9PROT|nr:response regulator [Lichenicoccus roseus]TLU71948.1 response regulator [Lichenicoccus roseus]
MCVLLVEDETLIREVMAESLQDAGYEVVEVDSGSVAVEMLRQPPRRFTALVTDFHMPGGVDGSQVAASVREKFPEIPVIIASGRPEALQPRWRDDYDYRLLRKPYLPSELITLLHTLIGPPA